MTLDKYALGDGRYDCTYTKIGGVELRLAINTLVTRSKQKKIQKGDATGVSGSRNYNHAVIIT